MKELLLKGENLQKRVPDQDKREQLRLKHNQLNSKYNTVKVKHTQTVEPEREISQTQIFVRLAPLVGPVPQE